MKTEKPLHQKINTISRFIFYFGVLFILGCLGAMYYYSDMTKKMKTNFYIMPNATGDIHVFDSLFVSVNDTTIMRLPVQLDNSQTNLKLSYPAKEQENCFSLITIDRKKLASDCIKTTADDRNVQIIIYVDNQNDSLVCKMFCATLQSSK